MYRRLFCSVAILSFSLFVCGQDSPAPKNPNIDPNAMATLDKMGHYLRTLTTFQVKSVQTTDTVLDNGQAIQSTRTIDMLAARPNRLLVDIKSDDEHPIFLYNGKNFTIYASLLNYYATVPAPATIAELIGKLQDRYEIDLPLVDVFMWGAGDSAERQSITSAIDIGSSSVEGTTCEQYAFRQDGLDWQIWIQQGDYPLPRKLVLTTVTDAARPRHTDVLTWNLAPSFNDLAFTFDPPEGAQKIAIAELTTSPGGTK